MRLLLRKAVRDLRQAWALLAAASALAAVAALLFTAFLSAAADVRDSCAETYARLRFLDFTVNLQTGPHDVVERLRALPGVVAAEGRLVAGVHVALPVGETPSLAGGYAISLPPGRRPAVNDVHVDAGRMIEQPRGEVLLERRFAEAHRIRVGDRLQIAQGPLRFGLTVVGLVSSPEYVWLVMDAADPRPSARRDVVMFVSRLDAEQLHGGPGINQVNACVDDPSHLDAIMREAEHVLGGRAVGSAIPRAAQASHGMLMRDQEAITAFGALLTAVFLSMAAIMVYSALSQLVARQRRQIGIMLACGCSPRQVILHYLAICVMSSGAGAGMGAVGGAWLGAAITRVYSTTVGLPFVAVHPHPGLAALGILVVLLFSLIAGTLTLTRLIKASPAALLRAPLSPLAHSRRLDVLGRLGLVFRLPARRLLRQPGRSAIMALGATASVALLVISLGLLDAQRATLDFFFETTHRYDLVVGLRNPSPRAVVPPVASWTGVAMVEEVLRRKCAIDSGRGRRELQVYGVTPAARLLRSYGRDGRPLPDDELLHLSLPDATALRVTTGDLVSVRIVTDRGDAPPLWCRVGEPLLDPVPSPPRLPRRALQRLAARSEGIAPDAVNMLLLTVAADAREHVRTRLEQTPQVGFATDIHEVREDVHQLLAVLDACLVLMNVLAGLLTFVLLAGGITVSVAERVREAATLCAIGVPDAMQVKMLLVEVGLLWGVGVALGGPLGFGLGQWLLSRYDSELLQLAMHLRPGSILTTLVATATVSLLAALAATRLLLAAPPTLASRDDE